MKKVLKSSEGFTLVELMVVVAIIGILSAVAIPNFKKYQAKSKQSEAKIALAALYTAETGSSADFDTYATCLGEIGYETPPRGYYVVGFNAGVTNAAVSATCLNTSDFNITPGVQLGAVTASIPTTLALATAVATQNAFIASADASIASGGANVLDRWTINQGKSLVNAQIGY